MTEELSQIHIEANGHTHLTKKIKELEGLNQMIAHNLRGTSSNIKMLADVLMNKNIPNDCSTNADDNIFTINEAIEYIQEASASLINTLDTLMMVADVQLNETIRYDNCNIANIIAHVSSQLGGFIQQKTRSWSIAWLCPVSATPSCIWRAFSTILSIIRLNILMKMCL